MSRPAPKGYLIATAAAFAWAGTSPGIAYLLGRHVPSLTIALWRDVIITLFCAGVLFFANRKLLRVDRNELKGLGIAGVVSIGIYHALWVWSVLLNGAAVAVVLIYLYPAFVTLGTWVMYRERITGTQLMALALSLAGCALVVRVYDPAVMRLNALGIAVGLLTALTHTVYVLFNQRRVSAQHLSPWTSLTYTMGFGALTLFVLTGVIAPAQLAPPADPLDVLVLVLLAIGPTLGGYGLFTLSLRFAPARIASLIVVLEVPIATMIAVLFLGERLEWPQVAGMALVLLAATLPGLAGEMAARRNDSSRIRNPDPQTLEGGAR
jgi:drug/metabolite transporter (DMT)-like permease